MFAKRRVAHNLKKAGKHSAKAQNARNPISRGLHQRLASRNLNQAMNYTQPPTNATKTQGRVGKKPY